ncbi:MAG: hypothetical protein IPF47_18865 [Gemmatimonadetes bacterium]|nr:hypothetical protein [Gemmatimonadota bacterium]
MRGGDGSPAALTGGGSALVELLPCLAVAAAVHDPAVAMRRSVSAALDDRAPLAQ